MNTATRTYMPKAAQIQRGWRVIDASGRPLGRLASEIAQVLKGKDKPTYTPHMDTGDFVIVVNASRVSVTGRKTSDKMYYWHSMYPGGFRQTSFEKMLAKHPRRVIEWAVWGMLPHNRLGRDLFRKLKVYAGPTHPHGAQVKDMAAPVKAGRPGKPRPPRKVRVRAPAPAAPAAPVAAAPVERAPEPVAAAAAPAPVAASETPVAAPAAPAPVEVAEVAAPAAEERPPEGAEPPAPLVVPPPRSRSRRERAREERESEPAPRDEAERQEERL